MTAGRHIICFGNALHGDDGFGPYMYQRLLQLEWPGDVRLFNAATSSLDALAWLEDCREAILVDALANRGSPGTVHVFKPEALEGLGNDLSGHAAGIPYLLQAAAAIYGTLPEVVVVGAEVGHVAPFAPGLTPAVAHAAERALGVIRDRLMS
ncbi:MAG TPA: hydrogenase maturation protease [Methylococcaceae bacterium]|nr:hydrogenase maturation protease [Methylococcaceae bacterium]